MSLTRRSLLAATAPVWAQKKPAAPARRPNVILVLADDLASWMLGCYGNQEIKTPNIDLLARTGVRFTNSVVCTPICSASRATLFTGRTPMQHGIHDFLTANPIAQPPQGQKEIPASFASEVMISDVLSQAGYRCGYVGKWHMGGDTKPGHGYSYTYTMNGGSRSYTDPEMFLNGEPVNEKGYLTDLMTARAVEFLDKQDAGSPFFLAVGYLNPHTPYAGHPQKYYDMYAGSTFDSFGTQPAAPNALREKELLNDIVGNLRKCAASVTALDDQLPVLVKKLRDKGLTGNTILIFAGDNGYLLGRHGYWSKGLASDPINMYEEVIGVPMIWCWPGKIPIESSRPEQVSSYDLLPSICDAAGVQTPDRNLCGRSYLPLALNHPLKKGDRWPDFAFGHFRNTEYARTNRFKLVLRNDGEGPNELWDLSKDPRERINQYDNPQYLTIREEFQNRLDGWRKKYSA